MKIGETVESLIKKNGITRLKLSQDTKLPYTTLTQIINGRTKSPQVKALEVLADYFNVSLDYLLGESVGALIEDQLKNLGKSLDWLSEQTGIPIEKLKNIDNLQPVPWDYEPNGIVNRIAKALGYKPGVLEKAFARQEPPGYDGSVLSPEDAFDQLKKDFEDEDFDTIAAHHDGEDWTDEELEEIERFKEFVRMKRQKGGQ